MMSGLVIMCFIKLHCRLPGFQGFRTN